MSLIQRKIRFRFLFESESFLLSRYDKFYVEAETFNDVIENTYQKMLLLAKEESIEISKGKIKIDSFYFNDKHDFQKYIKESRHNEKLNDDQIIFHITLHWTQDKNI